MLCVIPVLLVGPRHNIQFHEWFAFSLGISLHSLWLSHLGHVFRLDQGRYRGQIPMVSGCYTR